MAKIYTIHTERTLMYNELQKVMDYALEDDQYSQALENNITGKKSAGGVKKTQAYLTKIYSFDLTNPLFKSFKYFWRITDPAEKAMLTFLYAINQDDLLAKSLPVLQEILPGEKVPVEAFEEIIKKNYPNKYSANTLKSMSQNLASTWKQAGFIEGKVKNIRSQPLISPKVVCFAFLLAYLKGNRGEFILKSLGVQALLLKETEVRESAIECAKRDLMQYQYAGDVTAIGFNHLLNKIGIDTI